MQPELIPQFEPRPPKFLPALGCFAAALAVLMMCILPVFLVDAMQTALLRLHLSGPAATLAVIAILIGSMINLPVYRMPRNDVQPEIVMGLVYWGMMAPQFNARATGDSCGGQCRRLHRAGAGGRVAGPASVA